MIFKDNKGITYEGQYKNGKIEGRGKLTIPGKYTYEGDFIDGIKNGFGIQKYANSEKTYEGEYKDGKRNGYVTEYYYGSIIKFEGQYIDG